MPGIYHVTAKSGGKTYRYKVAARNKAHAEKKARERAKIDDTFGGGMPNNAKEKAALERKRKRNFGG